MKKFMKQHCQHALVKGAIALALLVNGPQLAAAADLAVDDGLKVSIEYTLSLPDKTVVGSNVGKEPASYTQGQHQIAPGLEKALKGMKPGEQKHVEVPAAEAYGVYDEKARVTIEKSQAPADVTVGSFLSSPEGAPVKVIEVTDDKVVLDTNHPLAGKDLVFDVKILKVEKAGAAAPVPHAAPPNAPASDAPAPK